MEKYDPQKLNSYAKRIELAMATSALLDLVLPEGNWTIANVERYSFIRSEIKNRPKLFQSLLEGKYNSALKIWSKLLHGQGSNVQFVHGLATVYREHALSQSRNGESNGRYWQSSTGLWAILLSTDEFWKYFSKERVTDRGTGGRKHLDPEQQNTLLNNALETILSLHGSVGGRDLAAGCYESAQVHLDCLDMCRKGSTSVQNYLKSHGITFRLVPNEKRMQKVIKLAEEKLDDVCVALVREAEKTVNDSEAIKSLPEGIRKNYEGAIQHLKSFVDLNIPVNRVLCKNLEWFNDWCYDMYVTDKFDQVKELIKSAKKVADQLIRISMKGKAFTPENQALSQYFLLRGFITEDPEKALEEYEEALDWNVANINAQQLLGDATHSIVMRQLDNAIECMKQKQFVDAYEILDSVEAQLKTQESSLSQVQQARSVVYFNHAYAEADNGKFREALKLGKKALQLEPQQPEIQKLVAEMEKLAPEEDNLRHMRAAREAMDEDNYDYAITSAAKVSRKSRFHSDACHLQSSAYFRRATVSAKNERFDDAEKDLKRSLELNDQKDEREIISEQLEIIQQAKIGYEVKKAADRGNWSRAEKILRDAMNKKISQKIKRQLQNHLSAILNAHAVSLMNEAQKTEQQFGEALQDIMKRVKRNQGVS